MVTKNKSAGGRPFALTPLVFRAVVDGTTNGLPRGAVASCAGISASSLRAYLKEGRQQKVSLSPAIFKKWMDGDHALTLPQRGQLLALLVVSERRAHGAAIKRNVEVIQAAALGRQVVEKRVITHRDGSVESVERFAPGQWAASAWWLERQCPEDFARRDHTTTTVKTADGHRGAAILIVDGPEKVNPPPEVALPMHS